MKLFIRNVLIFVLILSFICAGAAGFGFFVVGSQNEHNYQAALGDKLDRLNSIHEPKIILVGHSNLSFGMNSEMLESEMGMPVVNLGLHGGLGNAFHEEMAKSNINAGDIVVVCHSFFSDDDRISDTALAWLSIDHKTELLTVLRLKDLLPMIAAYPEHWKDSFRAWRLNRGNQPQTNSYSREAFNAYGDVVFKPEKGQMDRDAFFADPENEISVPQINRTCTRRLNRYNRLIQSKGATLVIAGYPIAYGEYADFTREDFDVFQEKLQAAVDCDVISRYTDYFYPYTYFYDTILHLTAEGADARTAQLISDLKKWMETR